MGSTSRTKGARGELEFIHALETLTRLPEGCLRRRLAQYQEGGCDLDIVPRASLPLDSIELLRQLDSFAVEIKRHARASPGDIANWWKQACRQAQQVARLPLLAFRADRETWQCLVPISQKLSTDDVRGCLRMDLTLFAEILVQGFDQKLPTFHSEPVSCLVN